ncbi:MAG: OprO/OprP family phosphate-selective porin [gamma proteobacterium symbiont of Bathyaustriella thionipta]|nr:OprO/OprP family phosphate-selective porin [gamma proteobacterium symbiont of Bathyaustriella thionipta]
MLKKIPIAMGLALFCAPTSLLLAADNTDLKAIQEQIEAMRADYEKRLEKMEKRLLQAEAQAAAAKKTASLAQQNASQAQVAVNNVQTDIDSVQEDMEAAETAPVNTHSKSGNAFNPAISLVLQGRASTYGNNPDDWHMPGFQLGGESGLPPRGLSLGETELTFSANASDWFYGQATLSVSDDGDETDVGFEEAYIDTLSLPYGLGLRFGRFYSAIAFQNTVHTHAWDFSDSPLAYQAFLGGQYSDDGLRLSWIAPTDTFFEVGAEVLRGDNYPGGDANNNSKIYGGAHSAFIHLGGDFGIDNSWKFGLAQMFVQPEDRVSSHLQAPDTSLSYDGDSRLTTASALYKWAPNGNPQQRAFTLESEYFYRSESGVQHFLQNGNSASIDYDGPQQGFYLQGVYKFRPEWRAGLRYDWLHSNNKLRVSSNPGGLDPHQILADSGLENSSDPYRLTAMMDFSHSEFGRFRLQYEYDHSAAKSDNLWTLQYIFSLGTHGAHQF